MANETITGKIFQLKDPSNSYNRFPRTVMEAVYGLNTYLQNQFSALADIYMPIEGITESKPLQEFVYRACPSTIKAKSFSLDRIYGKTLAWNQHFVTNSEVEINGVRKAYDSSTSLIHISGTATGNANGPMVSWTDNTFPVGHKILTRIEKVSGTFSSSTGYFSDQYNEPRINIPLSGGDDILTVGGYYSVVQIMNLQTGDTFDVYYRVSQYDLTLMFGAGNEPATVEEFEAMFPLPYYPYNAGTLISNDAESIETVGFNQWDEEWEVGSFDADNGNKSTDPTTIRSKNIIPIPVGQSLFINVYANVFYYGASKNWLSYERIENVSGGRLTVPQNARYINFRTLGNYGTTYNHDICINLSDPAKNGTYEPYRKSTMQLGLNSIKVKSHNIWDEEWEVGAYNSQGAPTSEYSDVIRSKNDNPIPVSPSTGYYFHVVHDSGNGGINIFYYDENRTFITGYTTLSNYGGAFTTPSNAKYIKFHVGQTTGSVYANDVCINVSSSFNGQYEPHGVLTLEGGLKSSFRKETDSAPLTIVRDEIIGNKYIKRHAAINLGSLNYYKSNNRFQATSALPGLNVGSSWQSDGGICALYERQYSFADTANYGLMGFSTGYLFVTDSAADSNALKTKLNGVYLYYELATPIEYELAEPLVPTVKAGTTEARISPNTDGLSAPMVADMTYDAHANNDSASAQYALTAGRLLNSHKLWGQDFDGTQDVTGALTGVTNLNSLLYFGSNNVGIGQPNPQYKLDVNGTFRATGNSTIGGTLTVTGNTTLNGNSLNVIGDSFFHSDMYLYSGMALFFDAGGDNGIWYNSSDSTIRFSFDYASHFTSGVYSDSYITAGASSASSDISLKTNVLSISADSAKSVMMALKPCEWDWNENSKLDGHCAGLVAQQVSPIIPYVVEKHGDYLSLNYNALHAFEIALAQNHETRIAQLEKENAELKAKVEQLKMR